MSLPYYVPDVAPGNCRIIADKVAFYLSQPEYQTLHYICSIVGDWGVQDKYSEPMVWIGIYIAVASSVCILAMVADLWHGFRNKKLWFPCRYFSLNAASITVITVTMKLPVDISSEMPSYMDQAAKLGSLAFMCTMMANLMPSLASMDNKTLLANVIGLSILVITMIVNIIVDIHTGVISHKKFNFLSSYSSFFDCVMVTYIYMAMILLLLIIMISSSLTIPTSKEILEAKYQVTSKASLTDQILQQTQMSIVEKLRQHVRRYWVMAETGSPQFVMASNPLSTASGVICVIVLVMNMLVVLEVPFGYHGEEKVYRSAYKWSMLFIIITQSIGVVVGTIAPIFRCFSVLSFNLVTKSNRNPLKVFKVEKYWTQKLYEWKQSHIPFFAIIRRSRTLVYIPSGNILNFCIILQKGTVIACKVIWLIPILVLYCWNSVEERMFTPSMASTTDDSIEDLRNYVLQIYDAMELAERTLKGISNAMNPFILKAEKDQSNNLLELLEKSTGFEGVERFDTNQVEPLLSVGLVNSWSLPIITLTCIAVALPNICKDQIDRLLESVGDGLSYSHLVEESLNTSSEYVNIRKTTMTLWHKVEWNCTWLENALSKNAFEGKTATEILKWFANKAKEIVIEINKSSNGKMVEKLPKELIAANSMYRIAQTILLRDQSNTEPLSKKQLFALLNGMIADILSACFTNLPRVIVMKCQESVIGKREASVKVAARLLGNTTKIIERLDKLELPSMDPDKMAYIDQWCIYLKQSIP
ncbi:hypothetical protein CTI12_AA282680 [Artemisia annua]|uniref:Uncharacterized protein n=1 Tax=Artemisia annua TaxID=35608 RepID=A0A2U1L0I5_ARTAN|nr:hypothetical protein CTI12_AA543910 [Artemisia annua]PWA71101.1 hypothetical protein CTI12_AA282680 [Artemisia annua]